MAAKYALLVTLKRKGERFPAGTVLSDLDADELKELKARKLVRFVPDEEPSEAAPAGEQGAQNQSGGKAAKAS